MMMNQDNMNAERRFEAMKKLVSEDLNSNSNIISGIRAYLNRYDASPEEKNIKLQKINEFQKGLKK